MRAVVVVALVAIGCGAPPSGGEVTPTTTTEPAGVADCGRATNCLAVGGDAPLSAASVNACADGHDATPAVETWMCHVRYCAGELSGRARCVAAHPVAPSSALADQPDTPGDCEQCLRSSLARWLGRPCDTPDPACKADDCDAADAFCRTH